MTIPAWKRAQAEAAIASEQVIIDPHHHFWEADSPATTVFGQFLPEDAEAAFLGCGHRIVATVYMECGAFYRADGPEHLRCVGETEFAEAAAVAAHAGPVRLAAGIVAHADCLLGEAVEEVLAAHCEVAPARLKGIRDGFAYDPDVTNYLGIKPEKSRDARFRAGFGVLRRLGLSFDAYVMHPQLGEVVELARAFPETSIILNHLGGPLGVGRFAGRRAEVFAQWRASVGTLAECPNVTMKLGGLGMELAGFGWEHDAAPPDSETLQAAIRPYILHAIDVFSPARCMFESNFPVDGVSYGYGVMWNAFKRIAAAFSRDEQDDLFHATAARVYRLTV